MSAMDIVIIVGAFTVAFLCLLIGLTVDQNDPYGWKKEKKALSTLLK